MAINQKWVRDVLADHRRLIHINVIYIVNDVNALTLAIVGRFDDPNVFLTLRLLQFLVMIVKVTKFFRQNVRIWHQIKLRFAILILHSHDVVA
jgi:hypothetical protein